jgi:glutathione S-transferase
VKIYGDLMSGNCLKVKYTADYLKLPYKWVDIEIMKGESRTPEFLRLSPMGQVPVIELDDGRALAQSNAIIRFLAAGSALLPTDPYLAAKVDELLFWEQYNHEPYVATTRYHVVYLGRSLAEREVWRVERGEKALDFMEAWLAQRQWFATEAFTIADIALLPYTRMAHEGGFDLATRPQLRSWITRVEAKLEIGSTEVAA